MAISASQFAAHHMESMYEMLDNNELTDVHFMFTENGESKSISAHKLVLATESPVFKAMFYGPLREKGDIKMVDESSSTFQVFLHAMYQQFDGINMGNVSDIMFLTDKFDTKIVMDYCIQFLRLNTNVNNICFVTGLALRYKGLLLIRCDFMILLYWKVILSSEAFLDIDCTTLEHIVQLKLCHRNEKETFDACIKWAQKSCEKQSIDVTPDNLRAELGPCFAYIQFDRMTLKEFVDCERSNPIFTFDEYKNIISNITKGPNIPTKTEDTPTPTVSTPK